MLHISNFRWKVRIGTALLLVAYFLKYFGKNLVSIIWLVNFSSLKKADYYQMKWPKNDLKHYCQKFILTCICTKKSHCYPIIHLLIDFLIKVSDRNAFEKKQYFIAFFQCLSFFVLLKCILEMEHTVVLYWIIEKYYWIFWLRALV